jgi:hypothetical protein
MQSCAFEFSLASSLLFGRSLLQLNPCPLSYVGIFLNQVQELYFNQSDRSSYPSMQARHAPNDQKSRLGRTRLVDLSRINPLYRPE